MSTSSTCEKLRANGDYVVGLSLAGCLIVPNWTLGVLIVFVLLQLVSSRFGLVFQSARAWNVEFHKTFRGAYANLRIAQAIILLLLILYHHDRLRELETPIKIIVANYAIAINIDRFRWNALVAGAATGAICAFAFAIFQLHVELDYRSTGATSAIRFGIISLTLGSVCAVGLLHARGDRGMALLSLAGFASGIAASFASGSRGALLALPFALVLLSPIVWKRSVRTFLAVAAFVVVFLTVLFASNVGDVSTRLANAYTNLSTMMADTGGDPSFGERAKQLRLAYQLFTDNPIAGAGVHGWNTAAEELVAAPDAADRMLVAYNQAHNQYADDLAKGGLIRFLIGLAVFLLPLYCFLRCQPFSDRPGSELPLAGVIVTVVFMISCFSEALMILSISAVVHTVLTTFLLAACDQAWERWTLPTQRTAVLSESGADHSADIDAHRSPSSGNLPLR